MLRKQWFLLSLVVVIPGGLWLGAAVSWDRAAAALGGLDAPARSLVANLPRISTALVLFLMSFSLETRQLAASFRSPGPVLWAWIVSLGLIPLAAWGLMGLQRPLDFQVGLMIAASVPCTLAAASVWTRKAAGNDAVSLMVTLATNAACFAMTPFWLKLTTGSSVALDAPKMMLDLFQTVLVPTALGQALRLFPRAARFATRHKTPLGVIAQLLILSIVGLAACKAGLKLSGLDDVPGAGAIAGVWLSCIGLHVAAMWIAVTGSRLFGFAPRDRIAVAFAASQKTLPIGVLVATDAAMFGNPALNVPWAMFPILMYHVSQLFIDTVVADRMSRSASPPAAVQPDGAAGGD
ncbi:MAG TPA: bile acid:sodium symporter [Planctomycetaceae bacterium]|nr:bile acid:sodium symporter [Planctomycetaceae bacterium]